MKNKLYPIKKIYFESKIKRYIKKHYKKPGRPSKIDDYEVFNAILYVLKTGIPWRDLPKNYGKWHTIYMRFKRWSENGLWWSILYKLQQKKSIIINIAWVHSPTVHLHKHGSKTLKKYS